MIIMIITMTTNLKTKRITIEEMINSIIKNVAAENGILSSFLIIQKKS